MFVNIWFIGALIDSGCEGLGAISHIPLSISWKPFLQFRLGGADF